MKEPNIRATSTTKCPKGAVLSRKHTLLVPFKTHNFIGGNADTDNSLF
jgi:hypothetical protein